VFFFFYFIFFGGEAALGAPLLGRVENLGLLKEPNGLAIAGSQVL
jgi:hypothetical protein